MPAPLRLKPGWILSRNCEGCGPSPPFCLSVASFKVTCRRPLRVEFSALDDGLLPKALMCWCAGACVCTGVGEQRCASASPDGGGLVIVSLKPRAIVRAFRLKHESFLVFKRGG